MRLPFISRGFQPQSEGAAYKRGFQDFNKIWRVVEKFSSMPNMSCIHVFKRSIM